MSLLKFELKKILAAEEAYLVIGYGAVDHRMVFLSK